MIGTKIKELRLAKGYNMRQMATALNLPYTTYVNYEKNAREPNSEQILLIAKYFGVTTDYLMGRTNLSDQNKTAPQLSEADAKGLEIFRRLSDKDKEMFLQLMADRLNSRQE